VTTARVPGSWRDPSGHVLTLDGRFYRSMTAGHAAWLASLRADGVLTTLEREGLLVPSQPVTDRARLAELAQHAPSAAEFLELEPLPLLTVPAEWTATMLADAGDLTLRLQQRLAPHGGTLKDATAHNIQFVPGAGARFIDHGSLVPATRRDLWPALGQFHRHFTIPLLLLRHRGWEIRTSHLGAMDGRTPAEALRTLGALERWAPRWLGVVTLPALLEGKGERSAPAAGKTEAAGRPEVLDWTLERERRRIRSLASGYRPAGTWAVYADACHYADEADRAKQQWVAERLRAAAPAWVLDLGANTGTYSRIAAAAGARVLAVEGDHDAAERLWRVVRSGTDPVVPVVADLSAPTPGLGFRGTERAPLMERMPRGTVLALAVIHHLLVRSNLPLEGVRDLLADLTEGDLLLEYVPPDDPMFRRLTRLHPEPFDWFTLERCLEVFGSRFTLVDRTPLPGSGRVLLAWRRGR
jgi:hypothetical protein